MSSAALGSHWVRPASRPHLNQGTLRPRFMLNASNIAPLDRSGQAGTSCVMMHLVPCACDRHPRVSTGCRATKMKLCGRNTASENPVCVCVCVCVYVCVRVCVRERERVRERQRDTERDRERQRERDCVCVLCLKTHTTPDQKRISCWDGCQVSKRVATHEAFTLLLRTKTWKPHKKNVFARLIPYASPRPGPSIKRPVPSPDRKPFRPVRVSSAVSLSRGRRGDRNGSFLEEFTWCAWRCCRVLATPCGVQTKCVLCCDACAFQRLFAKHK